MITQNSPILVPVIYLFAAVIVPLLGHRKPLYAFYTALFGSAAAFCVGFIGLITVIADGPISYHLAGWMPPLGIELVLDPLSSFITVIISGSTLMVMMYSMSSLAQEIPNKIVPFYSLSMLFLLGLSGMTITGDLFNFYVFLEIAALAGYGLLAIGDKRAPFSAFRYLTLGTAAAAFYLLGVALIFISTGTLNIADIAQVLPEVMDHPPVMIALVLIILGISVKMGLFPVHQWLPDAYTSASSTATALIAPIGTKVAAYILIRILTIYEYPPIIDILSIIAAASIIAGSILAIAQPNLKRMLAYSSVANIGYITLGITLATPLAYIGALLHILNHAMMKFVLFASVGGIMNNMKTLDITKLRGFPTVMPLTAVAFLIALFSMVGIPPTGGFFSKVYLLLGAIEAQSWLFVTVILFSTLLALVYLFRFLNIVFFRPYHPSDDKKVVQSEMPRFPEAEDQEFPVNKEFENMPRNDMKAGMLFPVLVVSLAIILVGVFNGVIVDIITLSIPSFPFSLR
jgi:multicomponent Na+:H+ antiporter subunit D